MRREASPELLELGSSALLREILAELKALNAKLGASSSLDPAARELLAELRASVGVGVAFGAAELLARADPELLAVTGEDAQALGCRLKALAGRPFEGAQLLRVGRDAAGAIWALERADAG